MCYVFLIQPTDLHIQQRELNVKGFYLLL